MRRISCILAFFMLMLTCAGAGDSLREQLVSALKQNDEVTFKQLVAIDAIAAMKALDPAPKLFRKDSKWEKSLVEALAGQMMKGLGLDEPPAPQTHEATPAAGDKSFDELCRACNQGDIAGVRNALPSAKDLNRGCEGLLSGMSPLCIAAKRQHLAIVGLLLQHGADPNFSPLIMDFPTTPPFVQGAGGYPGDFPLKKAVAEKLLAAGADINQGDGTGYNALMSAAYCGNLDMVLFLLKNGADTDAMTRYEKRTALYFARKNAHLEVVRALLDLGAK